MESPKPSARRVVWGLFGLAWTVAGGAVWFLLYAFSYGPCPKEGQYMYDPKIAHVIGAIWIIGGWLWIGSRMADISDRSKP